MSLIFATQLTAVATLALATLALATAILALLAWRKQSREVRDQGEMLRVQSEQLAEDRQVNAEQIRVFGLQSEELKREARDRRRAQAAQVFIMIGRSEIVDGQISLMSNAHNTSQLPVYDLWVQWRSSLGEFGTPSVVPQFLPGEVRPFTGVWTQGTRPSGPNVSLDFRDAAGVRWRTTSRGILTELCGAASPSLAREHCTFAPEHDGIHSWESALPGGTPTGEIASDVG